MLLLFLIGLLLSSAIGFFAYQRESLSKSGAIGAILTGTVTFTAGFEWALILIVFFVSSTILSKTNANRKAAVREQFSKGEQRDLGQVFANGGIAAIIALIYIITKESNLWLAYLGALATANADTWATEIGTLSQKPPRLITTFRSVDPGTSGGISALGMQATSAGAFLIGLVGAIFSAADFSWMAVIFIVTLAGIMGSLFDSCLGATVQALYWCEDRQKLTEKETCRDGQSATLRRGWAWVNNEVVNFSATAVGCVMGWILGSLI